jgi:hypothetical protein
MLAHNIPVNERKNKLMINMHSELEEYNAVAIDGYKNIFIAKEPYTAYTYIYTVFNKLIFRISKRNCLDQEKFIKDCLVIFDIIVNQNISAVEVKKISSITGISNFSSLILIPYEYCNHNPVSEKTLKKTIVVAPIYDCEFSGDENKEELEAMVNGPLATINLDNWEREISPKLKMSYVNYSTQSGSRSKIFKIAKSQNLHWSISVLKDHVSYIGFENFKHEKYKVALSNNRPFLTPTIGYTKDDFNQIINDILWGNFDYPKQVALSEKINIDAVEANNSKLIKLVDNCLNEFILKTYHFNKINKKKNSYILRNDNKQTIGVLEYSFVPSNYYKDNGCSLTMCLEAHISKCKVSDILDKIGLFCNNDCFIFNKHIGDYLKNSTLLKFYIAHGIYDDIISNASFVIKLIQKMNNLIEGNMEVIKDIETYPTLYKYPLATSLVILYLNDCNTEQSINQLLEVAKNMQFSDLDKFNHILMEVSRYFN